VTVLSAWFTLQLHHAPLDRASFVIPAGARCIPAAFVAQIGKKAISERAVHYH
jgi:hypothetical protein